MGIPGSEEPTVGSHFKKMVQDEKDPQNFMQMVKENVSEESFLLKVSLVETFVDLS